MTVCLALALLLLLAAVAVAVAVAVATNQCYDDCYEKKSCELFGQPSSRGRVRCQEKCERLCRHSENEKGPTMKERPIPDPMQGDGIASDANSANLHVPVLVGNTTCCENNITSVTWPKNATFDSVNATLLTAKSISTDEVTVAGGVHSKSTISSRIYTEDLASSGFISASTLVVKELGTFRGSISAKAVAAETVEADFASTQQLRSSTADVTGTLTAGKMEIKINGEVVDLAKEIASLQQRVKDLEEVLSSAEGVKECPKQEEEEE